MKKKASHFIVKIFHHGTTLKFQKTLGLKSQLIFQVDDLTCR